MKKKKQNLNYYIMKKYILFSLTLLIGVAIFINSIVAYQAKVNGVDFKKYFCAEFLVQPDYRSIDISGLQDLNGWIEILDENYKVIYTKGAVLEKKNSYTVKELLAQAIDQSVQENRTIMFAGIKITALNKKKDTRYFATYASFTGTDGKPYICVAKLPTDKLQVSYNMLNPTGDSQRWLTKTLFGTILGVVSIFLLLLLVYSHIMQKHIVKPMDMLIGGLEDITSGDYNKRLDFQAEYEFEKMRDSFNFMALEIETAKKRQKDYEQEKQQLFSNIAHDIKTPITTITGYSKALMDGLVTDEEKKKQYIETIYGKSTRVNELINLLFEYTKLDNKEYKLRFEQADLAELVREIIADCYEEIEAKQMELKLDIPEGNVIINMDKVEMRRAITNLIINAIKHNPDKTKLHVILKKLNNNNQSNPKELKPYIRLEIADNGTMIPDKIRESIFEPFVLGDKSRISSNGSGLGLSISKKIVEKHNGILSMVEKTDGWKCFRIEL